EGYFQTDRTNGFNPDGFNAPDGTPKHRKTYFDQSFTPEENQQAVEDALYQDIQDLLRSIQSQTNFAMPKPNPRRAPPVREIHNENTRLYAITDALDLVQAYTGWITDADYELLQDAYLEAAAEPANIEKCRELVDVLKELQIQYLADKFAAFCLVLSDKYEKIIAQLRTIAVTSENISRITEAVTKLTLVKTRAVEDSELCKKYGITPAIVRQIRINLWKLAETRHLLKEILQETESLVHN
ncbi:MAG: hypothetical protein LBJ25_02775, partial [Candidatus Margulisbacteria bacterium]|nr:hypothetical protein [Candidatus Margulisiibacteriota bacterium]